MRRYDPPGAVPGHRLTHVAALLAFGLLSMVVPAPAGLGPPVAEPGAAPVPPAWVATPVVLTEAVGAGPDQRVVALTFDDGPDPRWTPQVLAVLREHGAVATFCMVGAMAAARPDLVREVVAAGMRLCDHTRGHDEQLPDRDADRLADELLGGRDDIARSAGDGGARSAGDGGAVPYFRAPAGNWSPGLQAAAAAAGLQPLGWSVDAGDWRRPGAPAIVAAVQRQAHPGAVVLLHDGGGARDQTVAALRELLPWLAAQGYRTGFPTP